MKLFKNVSIGILFFLFCCFCQLAHCQISNTPVGKIDSLSFNSPILLNCKINLPNNFNFDKPTDLVISLHGGGGTYENFHKIWRHFENPQFIMATPEAPYKWLMADNIAYDWSAWPSGNLNFMIKALELTSTYIENLIISLKGKYNISNVYLMGFSQGSIITQIAGIKKHDLLDGIIILSGPEINHPGKPEIIWPSDSEIINANNLDIFIAHGKSDEIIDIKIANKSKEYYEKQGYNTLLFEFEGGHEINPEAMKKIEKWINKKD